MKLVSDWLAQIVLPKYEVLTKIHSADPDQQDWITEYSRYVVFVLPTYVGAGTLHIFIL